MAWVLVAWAVSLRQAINTIAPNRDKGSDGSIGDPAHATGVSGHNPDDTPGVIAERGDADSIPEVRAIDVDADLRQAGLTMLKIIQAILGSAAERARLIYIIFCPPGGTPVIWHKGDGWQARRYNGPNPHDKHAHFSGDPAADTNGSPWPSVLALGADVVTPAETEQIAVASGKEVLDDRKWADYVPNALGQRPLTTLPTAVFLARKDSYEAAQGVQELLARPSGPEVIIDTAVLQAAINNAVQAALMDPTVVASIATAVADEQHRRMQS